MTSGSRFNKYKQLTYIFCLVPLSVWPLLAQKLTIERVFFFCGLSLNTFPDGQHTTLLLVDLPRAALDAAMFTLPFAGHQILHSYHIIARTPLPHAVAATTLVITLPTTAFCSCSIPATDHLCLELVLRVLAEIGRRRSLSENELWPFLCSSIVRVGAT